MSGLIALLTLYSIFETYMFTVFVVCIYIYYTILFFIILDIYTYEQHPSEKIKNLVYHLLEGC